MSPSPARRRLPLLIASLLIITIIPTVIFLQRNADPAAAWYSSSWNYRNPISVGNTSGSTLTNEDVLITIDTATLISAGKLQSSCQDLRFVDSDDTTLITYWIEDDCNTAATKIWVQIPSLPNGGKTIYVYYGNSGAAAASLTWNGNIYMYADTNCPSGWTRADSLITKFLYGSSTSGSTGGTESHSHTTLACTSTSISTTTIAGSTSSGITSTNTTHTHTNLSATVNTNSFAIPPSRNMILCYNNRFSLNSGLISLFDDTAPSGWTRFSELDGYFPRIQFTYGSINGSSTHTHTTNTGSATAGPSATATSISEPLNATGGTITYPSGYKVHRFTSSGTFAANVAGTVEVLVVAGGGGGGTGCEDCNWGGGGGGAGGVIYDGSKAITAGNKTVTVGGGGSPATNGGNSVFDNITATGGGKGGGGTGAPTTTGGNGGSGGGGAKYTTGGTGIAGQGYNGGNFGGASIAGGGGGKGEAGNTDGQGHGGDGVAYSITGSSVYYGGGGSGAPLGSAESPIAGSTGGGGGTTYNGVGANGTANTGGGGGGGGELGSRLGGSGGSGVVIVRYTDPPALSGTGSTGTHTHTSSSVNINSASIMPPYVTMVFAKADSTTYANEANILPASALPPLGWNRYSSLDNKFVLGSATAGTAGGNATHAHGTTIYSGGPSATVSIYGTGANFANSTHTHSCVTSTDTVSNLPPYYSVLYIQRKTSQSISLTGKESYNQAPNAPTSLLTEGLTNPTGVIDLTPEFKATFTDPDAGNTGVYYQIQVNTNNTFTGTTMWDSTKTAISAIINGAASPDISYAGTTLTHNGTIYYWRIKFWDQDDAESAWSATVTFTLDTNIPPNTPSLDQPTNTQTNVDRYPIFKTTATDSHSDNLKYLLQICTNSGMTENCQTYDQTTSQIGWSGQNADGNTSYTSGTQATFTSPIPLASLSTYYWRTYAIDYAGSNTWSGTQTPYSFTIIYFETATEFEGVGMEGVSIE